jgi:S-adenosyl-L-methionine hydrolase (adenosine-forming)
LSIITLTTDFGLKDGNVGVMKGVIWGINPDVQIADLSHNISPQNVREAALILRRSAVYFPPGTIHVVVVDPGVGTTRRPIAGRLGPYYFVGPDNGVITMLLEEANLQQWEAAFFEADKPDYWLPEVSNVFHGRDIFSPVAAHLSRGIPLDVLGSSIQDPVLLHLAQPIQTEDSILGEVIHIDHFGNLSTNIRIEHLGRPHDVKVHILEYNIDGLVNTFGDQPPGSVIALYGSTGNLIISVVNGSAEMRLGAHIGDIVRVLFSNRR